ncbi:cytochrome c [Amphritea sp. RP18W]|uniref:Cytochrome c n=2 Tax=Amphritea pacifica TaxID=2811233 RepID=A0ABS2W2H7_9GAMM|nr:cytochrome c [Amphritea pacifica]
MQIIKMKNLLAIICGGMLLSGCSESEPTVEGRWYTQTQVNTGQQLFLDNCAECHGAVAQGTNNWNKPEPDGSYPPPPLNGRAHAWHHPLKGLKRSVKVGGVPMGGKMPGFGDKLSDADIEAVISYFQSKWPAPIYQAWLDRGGLK